MSNTMFRSVILFIALAALAESIPHARIKRYSRGQNAKRGQWPWQVLIQKEPGEGSICGGSVLNANWVLTAGHCVNNSDIKNPLAMKLHFGLLNKKVEKGIEVGIAQVHTYPGYETNGYSNDIGLIKLKRPLDLSNFGRNNIQPVCLNLSPMNLRGLKCFGTGWGRLSAWENTPDILQQLEMKEYSLEKCAELHKSFHDVERVSHQHVCMVSTYNPYPDFGSSYGAVCAGDSGGPLQCFKGSQWYQVGVAWSNTHCEQNPSVFNRVDKYVDWIVKVSGYQSPERCDSQHAEDDTKV